MKTLLRECHEDLVKESLQAIVKAKPRPLSWIHGRLKRIYYMLTQALFRALTRAFYMVRCLERPH